MEAFSTETYKGDCLVGLCYVLCVVTRVLRKALLRTETTRKVNEWLKIVCFFFENPPTVRVSPDRNSRSDSMQKNSVSFMRVMAEKDFFCWQYKHTDKLKLSRRA